MIINRFLYEYIITDIFVFSKFKRIKIKIRNY